MQAWIGQGKFKERVSTYERSCRITQVNNPTHLIASPIKPWGESNNVERFSGGNALLLTPSFDHFLILASYPSEITVSLSLFQSPILDHWNTWVCSQLMSVASILTKSFP